MEKICEERLEKLGLKTASKKIKDLKELRRKMSIAYEHFRFVTPDKINVFNDKLRKETEKQDNYYIQYDTLSFIPLVEYEEVPPSEVLDKIEQAQEIGCFDTFEIAKISAIKERKDPIVFGCINGCPDKFFIGQWDDDVRIEDILKENEG